MQSKQILLALLTFTLAFARANPLETRQDSSAKFVCTYDTWEGGGDGEGPATKVTVQIETRGDCVAYTNSGLDPCGCMARDAMDRPGCRMACTNKCAKDCAGEKN